MTLWKTIDKVLTGLSNVEAIDILARTACSGGR